ncbi:hypothetical protein [Indiicoccus explosivorum]|uniref:hypothetical protein n=1 Tax=Indiicoccus explosivorum TaxID=1917864 RepID=UPI000B44E12F|nr:hypothetical protein [Indiicoccus explosivorum]
MHEMIARTMDHLILIAGAWEKSGQTDKGLERQFNAKLNELQGMTQLSHENSVRLLVRYMAGEAVA